MDLLRPAHVYVQHTHFAFALQSDYFGSESAVKVAVHLVGFDEVSAAFSLLEIVYRSEEIVSPMGFPCPWLPSCARDAESERCRKLGSEKAAKSPFAHSGRTDEYQRTIGTQDTFHYKRWK